MTALESTRSDLTFEHMLVGDPVNADLNALYRNVYDRVLATQSFFLSEVQEYAKDIEANNTAGDAYFSDSWPKDIKALRKQKGLPVGDVARFAPLADFVSGQERQQ